MITYKSSDARPPYRWKETDLTYRVKENAVRATALQLRPYLAEGVILIHGGGTHGHRTVRRWSVGAVKGSEQRRIWEVKWRMLQLTAAIVKLLGENGLPAVSVSPSDVIRMSGSAIDSFETGPISDILRIGCVPVLRGDLAPGDDGSWSVVSGDEIMIELIRKGNEGSIPRVDQAVMCLDVDGFYRNYGGKDQELIREIGPNDFHNSLPVWMAGINGNNDTHDVTGGILRKVRSCHRIAAQECDVWLVGDPLEGSIELALSGKGSGTLFRAFDGDAGCRDGGCMVREVDGE